MTIEAATKSADDTRDLAAQIAGVTNASDLVLLTGDLGAGKTTFTQGFGRALGVESPITSPTFTLVHQYEGRGRIEVVHADVYRLERLQEVIDLGLPEMLDQGAIGLIEWGEAAAPVLPHEYLQISIGFGDGEDDRRFALEPVGKVWQLRSNSIRTAIDRWLLR